MFENTEEAIKKGAQKTQDEGKKNKNKKRCVGKYHTLTIEQLQLGVHSGAPEGSVVPSRSRHVCWFVIVVVVMFSHIDILPS